MKLTACQALVGHNTCELVSSSMLSIAVASPTLNLFNLRLGNAMPRLARSRGKVDCEERLRSLLTNQIGDELIGTATTTTSRAAQSLSILS